MTETLNSIEWFANYKKFDFKEITIGGVYFNYIALTDEMIESVKSCVTSEAMLSMAADYGMSNKRARITDDEEDANNIEDFWLSPLLSAECERPIKQQLGELVCQASDLQGAIDEMRFLEADAEEAPATISFIDGDNLPDDLDIDDLNRDAIVNANA